MSEKSTWNWADAGQQFGGTFFVLGYFANYFARSHKLVKDDDRHNDVIAQQQHLLSQMQNTAKSVADYATGGDGFVAVWFARVKVQGSKKHIYELNYKVEGEYPLYDVSVRFSNMDDPVMHAAIRRGDMSSFFDHVHLGNIVPRLTYNIRTNIPIIDGRPNRLNVNWYARNGTWHQRFELRSVGDSWQMATFVKRGEKEIMVKAITDYELDDQGRPKFDLSPSALDSSSV